MIPNPGDTLGTLAQADLLLMLARMLDRPGSSRSRPLEIGDDDLAELARCAGLGEGPHAAGARDALRRIVGATQDLDPAPWIAEHSRLFEGPILCPPNETGYVRRDKGAILADICGFYTAFGFRLSDASGEKADHLISELEFLALLLVMLAQARRRGSVPDEEVALRALHAFASDHLDEWLPLFAERLEATTALPLYRDVARVLLLAWEALLGAHGVERGQLDPTQQPATDPGSPYECDMADPAIVSVSPPRDPPGSPLETRARPRSRPD